MMNSNLGMMLTSLLCFTVVFGVALSGAPPWDDAPQAEIKNSELQAKVYLPDARRGYYRGTRFDWSGVVASLLHKGHDYYGPWYNRVDPLTSMTSSTTGGNPCLYLFGDFRSGGRVFDQPQRPWMG